MDMRVVAGIILLGLIVLVGIFLWAYQRRRTARLRSRFGSEYERTVRDRAGRSGAEAELEARVQRVKALHIHELDSNDRARLAQAWQSVQTQFADDPQGAVMAADRLVAEAMQARGYPVGDPSSAWPISPCTTPRWWTTTDEPERYRREPIAGRQARRICEGP